MSTAYSSAKQKYIGNGVTTEWGFDFPIQKHSELKVYLKRSSLPQVLLEEGVDYSFVTENTIAFPIKTGEAKLQATDVLALQRESVFESEYNFSNQQRLEPEEVMHADDNLERQIQELKRDSESAIKVQPTSNINTDEYFIAVESIYENLDNITNVSGISAEIVNCSDNISDISTVSSNIANVNAVVQSISNVNTVANNISDVNTAALNIEAIKDAPNQANAASQSASDASQSATNAANSATDSSNSATASATSANNSHIWAEGTDAQVQALGGVHSSKGWAEQSTNANISLTNSPYTTNRILEIPQDIKLELNNGTLTLKAGSKVYVPNGFESDGTTPKFDEVVIGGNINGGQSGTRSGVFYLVSPNRNSMASALLSSMYSGSTEPTGTTYAFWYDTVNNRIGQRKSGSSTFTFGYSFPVCVGTIANNLLTSIDQIFNGFGYIGSTVFALPGVKVQTPNGKNVDGTYKTVIRIIDSVRTYNAGAWGTRNLNISFSGGVDSILFETLATDWFTYNKKFSSDTATVSYDENTGLWWFSPNQSSWSQISVNIVGSCRVESGRITSFEPYTVDSIVNSNEFYQLKDKTVTTDTAQTISASKRFTRPPEGMSIEFTADTNQQTVPATATIRQLGLYRNSTYTKGDGYTSWIQGYRGSNGITSCGLFVRRLLEGDNQEILNYVQPHILADGTLVTYTKTPPAVCAGDEIVTAAWVRNAYLFPGEIIIWSAPNPPAGYLVCNGAAISRTTYANLFNVIGTTWGAGDGNTTFNLPNLVDRAPWYSGKLSVGQLGNGHLPNITGVFTGDRIALGFTTSGAFYNTTSVARGNPSGSDANTAAVGFDASRSSQVYGNTDRVIPAYSTCLYCIRY